MKESKHTTKNSFQNLGLILKKWDNFRTKVTAVDRAGLYIPGGKAAYPSSLLMNAIPAKICRS